MLTFPGNVRKKGTLFLGFFSKAQSNLRENGQMSWDFTEGGDEAPTKRKSILNLPEPSSGGAPFSGTPFSSSGGGNSPFSGGMSMGGSGPKGSNMGGGGGGGGMGGNGMGGGGMGGNGMGGGGMGGGGMGGGGMGGGGMRGGSGGGSMGGGGIGGYYGGYGGGGGDMAYGTIANYSGGGGGMGGEEGKSCVLLVYGLESPKWNCERVFNMLCQAGNLTSFEKQGCRSRPFWLEPAPFFLVRLLLLLYCKYFIFTGP